MLFRSLVQGFNLVPHSLFLATVVLGGILGPVVGAAVLASGQPIVRSYALLAVCPAVLCLSAIGIHRVERARNS